MENPKKLKIGAFQFAGSGNVENNLAALRRGIERAAQQNVRLLLTQECALCGYPPVEVASCQAIDRAGQSAAYDEICRLAAMHRMYVALGMVTFAGAKTYNSIRLIPPGVSERRPYHKRGLWGWDRKNFQPGMETGIYRIDGIKVGVRICFEVRFPEYFRQLFLKHVDLALVSLADVGSRERKGRFNTIQSHLISRAAENAMYVLSANSTSQHQWAPTCLIDPDGEVVCAAPRDREYLLASELEIKQPDFGRRGRIEYSKALMA